MSNSKDDGVLEQDLSRRFASMRAQDRAELPPLPEIPGEHLAAPANHNTPLRYALAAAIILAAGILVTRQPTGEDPALLYADIMDSYALDTDDLLQVSASLSPEMTGLPELFSPLPPGDIDASVN